MSTSLSNKIPLLIFGAIITALSLGPAILMVIYSFKLNVDIVGNSSSLVFMPTLENYKVILCDIFPQDSSNYCDTGFTDSIVNSIYISLISTLISIAFGSMFAYVLARFSFAYKGVISFNILLMRMLPPAVLLVPIFGIWTYQYCIYGYCLAGTTTGIILLYTAINLPLLIWILQAFIKQIPIQLEESAWIDGASNWQVFLFVVVPLIRPAIAAIGVFTFRISWNEFILANILLDRNTRTAPVYIANSFTEHNINWGEIMATGTLLAIPPIIFTIFIYRHQAAFKIDLLK